MCHNNPLERYTSLASTLYTKSIYLAPIDYIINTSITEYDISKANINILLYLGKISQQQYDYYYNLPKGKREIAVGMLQKDPNMALALKQGLVEFKKKFFEANAIEDYEVLSVKSDAIFLINKIPKVTRFDNVVFAEKKTYTSYYRLGRIECYYFYEYFSQKEYMDIKGMSEEKQALHEHYFIDFLKCLFNSAQLDPLTETISLLREFQSDYINLKLEMPYYREFNAGSTYSIKPPPNSSRVFKVDFFDPAYLNYIDIHYNESLLRNLHKIYASMYFTGK